MDDKTLLERARDARERAYAPYSGFCVGVALLSRSGEIYTGCNVENASYGATNCAERTAFFKAVSEGEREFSRIAIVGGSGCGTACCPPCGICRHVMREFCNPDEFYSVLEDGDGGMKKFLLRDLLPEGFGPENL